MANLIDRVLLGGAFVCSGLIHRKVSQVEHRVEHVEQVQADALAEDPQGPGPDAPSGMPLPTGYGIQVAGPGNEDIVIPICLPPGFELASLVIVPSFLPDGERAPAEHARPRAVAPLADDDSDAPAPAAGAPPAERLDGGVRLVYGESQPYSAQLDQTPLPAPGEREEPALREAPPLRDSVL